MNRAVLSIDPGSKGFLTLRTIKDEFSFLPIDGSSTAEIAKFIHMAKINNDSLYCVMEEVHAVFGSSAKATFAFGEINGLLKGMLTAFCVPYTLVQPKQWQKEVWITQDHVYVSKNGKRTIDTKNTSYNAALRLFPDLDLRKSDRAKKFDDNKVDSILIGEYARRRIYG